MYRARLWIHVSRAPLEVRLRYFASPRATRDRPDAGRGSASRAGWSWRDVRTCHVPGRVNVRRKRNRDRQPTARHRDWHRHKDIDTTRTQTALSTRRHADTRTATQRTGHKRHHICTQCTRTRMPQGMPCSPARPRSRKGRRRPEQGSVQRRRRGERRAAAATPPSTRAARRTRAQAAVGKGHDGGGRSGEGGAPAARAARLRRAQRRRRRETAAIAQQATRWRAGRTRAGG